jgi:HK97 family phage major capsid protein
MGNAVLDRLTEERSSAVEFVDNLLSQVAEEGRDLVETEQRSLDSYRERIGEIDKQMAPIAAFEETRQSAVVIDRAIGRAPARTSPRPSAPEFRGGFGDLYVNSEDYAERRGGPGTRLDMPEVNPLDLAYETRAVITEGAAPGKNLLPAVQKFYAPGAEFMTPLLDVITRVPVAGSSVDVISYGQAATGADVVAEGAAKPEGTLTTAVANTPLETIAVWAQYTRQLAQDAPAAIQIINSQLTRGVLKKLESEVASVVGGATGTTTGASKAPALNVVRQAMATVYANGFSPDVVLGSPADLAGLDLDIMGLGGAYAALTQAGYFGLRAVPVPGLTDMYVADAAAAMTLFTRTGVEVFTTDSDIIDGATVSSAFRKNVLTTVVEIRAKAALINQAAITKIAVTP